MVQICSRYLSTSELRIVHRVAELFKPGISGMESLSDFTSNARTVFHQARSVRSCISLVDQPGSQAKCSEAARPT